MNEITFWDFDTNEARTVADWEDAAWNPYHQHVQHDTCWGEGMQDVAFAHTHDQDGPHSHYLDHLVDDCVYGNGEAWLWDPTQPGERGHRLAITPL